MKRLVILVSMIFFPLTALGQDEVDFMEDIQPILEENCYSCHGPGPEADKGALRLHAKQAILESDVVVGGDVEASELFARISLEPNDFDFMPQDGEPLSDEEIELIRKWIATGAEMPDGDHLEADGGTADASTPVRSVPPAPKDAIQAIADTGANVMSLSESDNRLTIGYGSSADQVGDAELSLLPSVAEQLVWLNLARTNVTNKGVATLAKLPNLTRLHLELTDVTDEALAHIGKLKNLEYLNLYGTKITDAGLDHLQDLTNLKKLYLWQTKVSYDKAMALQKKIEGLQVNLGHDHPGVVRARLNEQIERATKRMEDAAAREKQARMEKEAAEKLLKEARTKLAELDKPDEKQSGDSEGETADKENAENDSPKKGENKSDQPKKPDNPSNKEAKQ